MKAILLSGGTGSRLYPLTKCFSKHFQAIYDKPMAYYPVALLMAAGVREFCIISTPQDIPNFRELFGAGDKWGVSFEYIEQPSPDGIAQALILGEKFIAGDNFALALGDNIFSGSSEVMGAVQSFESGALIFAYRVENPSDYGIIEFDSKVRALSLTEKPQEPKSNYAVPGLYLYDSRAVGIAKALKPSNRGELEITDVNQAFLELGELEVCRLGRGFAWLDAGTSTNLQAASDYIRTIEARQGQKIGCPEEVALQRRFISKSQFKFLLQEMPACEYKKYLSDVLEELESQRFFD